MEATDGMTFLEARCGHISATSRKFQSLFLNNGGVSGGERMIADLFT